MRSIRDARQAGAKPGRETSGREDRNGKRNGKRIIRFGFEQK
jgi:hypothetical protein